VHFLRWYLQAAHAVFVPPDPVIAAQQIPPTPFPSLPPLPSPTPSPTLPPSLPPPKCQPKSLLLLLLHRCRGGSSNNPHCTNPHHHLRNTTISIITILTLPLKIPPHESIHLLQPLSLSLYLYVYLFLSTYLIFTPLLLTRNDTAASPNRDSSSSPNRRPWA
jgi:hypothetical protein